MVEKSRRDRVGLGLIGLGPSWEQSYREALIRLRHRLTIRLVYDPVEARARLASHELEAEVAGSLQQILARTTLQGLLVLDSGWLGGAALGMVAQSGKPVFLSGDVLRRISGASCRLFDSVARTLDGEASCLLNDQFMPELAMRFTPATCRLRELIATKLGPVKTLRIHGEFTDDLHQTGTVIDWFSHVMGGPPTGWKASRNGTSDETQIEFDFPDLEHRVETSRRLATLVRQVDGKNPLRIDVQCQNGHATVTGRTRIIWRLAGETVEESLTEERTEIEILIDQFCRRALGGLNPVGRLSEHLRALEFAQAIRNELN